MRPFLALALILTAASLAAAEKSAADHVNEAREHVKANRLEAAAEAARAALALEADDPEANHLLGLAIRYQADLRDQAEAAFKRAVELKPDEARYHHDLGSFYRQTDRLEPALAAFQRAMTLDDRSTQHATAVASLAKQMQRWAEAEAAYRRLMELEPDRELHIREAARAAAAQKRAVEAEQLYLRAVARLSDLAALQTLANEVAPYELWAVVKAVGSRILDQQANTPMGHYLLGVGYERQDKLALAEMSYRRTALLAPREAMAWLHLGRVLRKERRWSESEAMLLAAIGLVEGLADAHNELGVLDSDQGRHAEAVAHYARAAELAPGSPQILYNHGKTLLDLGRYAEAEAVLRKLLAVTGPHAEVQKLLDQAVAAQAPPPPAPAA